MTVQLELEERGHGPADRNRERLLAGVPLSEHRLELAGMRTALLEGGDGPPIVLLHGPGEFAARWLRVAPELVTTHRVIAPDLPGHGASELGELTPGAGRVLEWLDELIERTCSTPPVIVGHLLGGAIAARFAARNGERLSKLVLVDTFGLKPLRPSPTFALALIRFLARPSESSYERFMGQCLFDRDSVREQMDDRWEPLRAYSLDRARAPRVKSAMRLFMRELGVPAIAPEDLARIAVPTRLVWGRHDRANRLRVAEAASARFGWPLTVIENAADDPPMEQPAAFVRALRAA